MNFKVKIRRVYYNTIDIDAENVEQALAIAQDADTMGELDLPFKHVTYEVLDD